MFSLPRVKMISDPQYGFIDISPVLPMIETEEFQALRGRCQMSHLSFPSAMHTRFAHSLGAYHATRVRANQWIRSGYITEEEGNALCGHALIHDIGHGALSHVTEDLCPMDHKEMGVIHANNLKEAVEACGINHELMLKLLKHDHPLWVAVADKNVGTEKLDYLERDGLSTVQAAPMGIASLREYSYYLDGKIVIDAKVRDFAMRAQDFYLEMFKEVYFRKSLVIAQRMFQKMVYNIIAARELNPHTLFFLTDAELWAKAFTSKNGTVQKKLYDLLRRRELFKEAIVFRPKAFTHETRINDKAINVRPLSWTEMQQLVHSPYIQKGNHETLDRLEDEIADCANIPRGEVLLVPVFNPERFKAQDINVLFGDQQKIHSLKELMPKHFLAMEEMARSYTALRICTLKEHRQELASLPVAEKVASLLFIRAT
jgi:HD superfamily phosphohydrolase